MESALRTPKGRKFWLTVNAHYWVTFPKAILGFS